MDRASWSRIDTLFNAALARPPETRTRYIADACRDDPALERELRALLAAEARADELLDELAGQASALLGELAGQAGGAAQVGRASSLPDGQAAALLSELAADAALREVGPYRILRRVAVGGMGAVYLAERADGEFEQRVALKLVKRGMDSAQIVARFRAERQILARLEHPSIARLLDGGVTPDGRPWFAMEYVAGEPLGRYCDARGFSIDQRLRLFLDVCQAVQYAHRSLVVHRDLKPDNILVTAEGQVKLLDFGIAKLLDPDDDAATLTRTGLRPMTPDYAAPEQVLGELVTTATDVYALGVVLYELISGRRPFGAPARTAAESERRARTGEPDRPSVALTRRPAAAAVRGVVRHGGAAAAEASGGGAADGPAAGAVARDADAVTLARARGTQPDRLRRRLAGDLDTICLAALRREPERRYGSVEALADDVDRHLRGLPVHARPDTAAYRVRKFVGRHRAGVAATAAVAALFTAGVAVHTAQLARERDVADRQRAAAEQVTAFLTDIFRSADPTHTLGDTITARQLLAGARRRLDSALVSQPRVRARLLGTLGTVYEGLGRYAQADSLLQQGLALTERTDGASSPRVAALLEEREQVRVGMEDWDGAIRAGRRAVAIREAASDTAALAESVRRLAGVYVNHRDFSSAAPLIRRALALQEATKGADALEVATTLQTLGGLLYFQAHYDSALVVDRRALAIRRAHLDPRDPAIALELQNLAVVQDRLGQVDSARASYEAALAIARAAYGPDHPKVTSLERSLADVLAELGRTDSALALHRRVLRSAQRTYGDTSQNVAAALLSIGADYARVGRNLESLPWFRRSLAVSEKVLPADNPNLYYPLINLVVVDNMVGRYAEAVPLARRALAVKEKAVGVSHPDVAETLYALGTSLAGTGHDDEAASDFRQAIGIYEKTMPAGNAMVGYPLEGLANLDARRGRYAEAVRLYARALPLVDGRLYRHDAPAMAAFLENYARALRHTGEAAKARPLEARARAIRAGTSSGRGGAGGA